MNSSQLSLLSKIALILFGYILIHFLYIGFISQPTEMDSLTYHIPTATHILQGTILTTQFPHTHQYFPGASEIILAIFIFFGIPLNLYNCLAVIFLIVVCYQLATVCSLSKSLAIIFAIAICSMTVVLRWINAQTVDIWLSVYYVSAVVLLFKPKESWKYYFLLGIVCGMLIGTKYSGPLYMMGLVLLFWKNLITNLNWERLLIWAVPVMLLGVFWYIRNFFLIHNPFYPLDLPFFSGTKGNPIIRIQIWRSLILYPKAMLDAYIGEYMFWGIGIFLIPVIYIKDLWKKNIFPNSVYQLLLLGLINVGVFMILPSWDSYQNHVSSFRFSYPAFIPLILVTFLILSQKKRVEILILATIVSMVAIGILTYYPKLLLLYLPFAYFLFTRSIIFDKTDKK